MYGHGIGKVKSIYLYLRNLITTKQSNSALLLMSEIDLAKVKTDRLQRDNS